MSIGSALRRACLGISLLALGCGGDPTDELIAQLQDADVAIRRAAVRALCDHHGPTIVMIALADAVGDSDTEVRRVAIYALGERGAQATTFVPILLPTLKDPQLSVRLAAALAIQKIEPDNERIIPVLVDALRAGEGGIFLEVAEMGPDAKWAVSTLIRLLSHPETKIRALTARTLGQLGPTAGDAQSALKRSLRDPEEAVRQAAQQALAQIE